MLGFNGGLLGTRRTISTASAPGLWFPNEQTLARGDGLWPSALPAEQFILIGTSLSPFLAAYRWSSSGFGARYANPSNVTGIKVTRDIAVSPSKAAVVIAYEGDSGLWGTPSAATGITGYKWSLSSGFGARYAEPSVKPADSTFDGYGYSVAFSPSGKAVLLGGTYGNKLNAYAWDDDLGFGLKYSNPESPTFRSIRSISFHPSGKAFVYAHEATSDPRVVAYAWDDDTGFGFRYPNPASSISAQTYAISFSRDGRVVFVGHSGSSGIAAYEWSNESGFGARYPNPATSAPGGGFGLSTSQDGSLVAVAHGSFPYISVYQWSNSSGFGAKLSNPAQSLVSTALTTSFDLLGSSLAVGMNVSPYIDIYQWDDTTGFGAKRSQPGSPVVAASTVRAIAFDSIRLSAVGISIPSIEIVPTVLDVQVRTEPRINIPEISAHVEVLAPSIRTDPRINVPLKQVTSAGLVPAGVGFIDTDPLFNNFVSLLLHGDGVDNSQTILDSRYDLPVYVFGNTKISSTQSKFGGTSISFDGDGDFLTTLDFSGTFGVGLDPFTIETWVYLNSYGVASGSFAGHIIDTRPNSASNYANGLSWLFTPTGELTVYTNATLATSTAIVPLGEWVHLALTRTSGSVGKMFIGGTEVASFSFTNILFGDRVTIGQTTARVSQSVANFDGFMDEFRITRYVSRYNESFSPPTRPFPGP